ncbi:MAG: GNAT family N-acetyltransferase [Bacteroidales bacterium]|nr:GNAT family N-acetyltransferase [Bacteroidales bacterium]
MENIVIRDYKPEDYPAITDLWLKTGLGGAHRGDNQQIIEKSIKMGGRMLIAEDQGKRLLATSWMTFDGRRIHLHHFGVLPAFQGRGIGKKLAIESIRFAKNKGFQIKLEVHKTNTEAIKLYTQLGFSYLGDYLVYIVRSYDD